MPYTVLTDRLINELRCLPGVGPRSAQRMAFYLLERGRDNGLNIAKALEAAINKVGKCKKCRNFSEAELCDICSNHQRNTSLLCVVETPADIVAIEKTCSYNGRYFVLMGHLSPIDGIGPNDIGIGQLVALLAEEIKEVILATNSTVEGETTAHYLAGIIRGKGIKCTRIAYGIPLGGEIDYIDLNTLAHALSGRQEVS